MPKKGYQRKTGRIGREECRDWSLRKDKERLKREEGRTIGAVKEIEKLLGLKGIVQDGGL